MRVRRDGMAHLLEHMDFIETTTGGRSRMRSSAAARRGTAPRLTTAPITTRPCPPATRISVALGLEADRMIKVKFTKPILDTEMTVVRNEFERGENSPQSILRERVEATAYLWHNYGKSTIGSKDDLEKVPVERLEGFYKKFYQPDNAVLVLTGRLDEAKTLQAVADTMGRIPRPRASWSRLTQWSRRRMASVSWSCGASVRAGRDVAYHGPAAGHADSAALQVLAGS